MIKQTAFIAALAFALPAFGQGSEGKLQIEIHAPDKGHVYTETDTSVQVDGMASVFGGVKYLDLVLVVDSSSSLKKTDPSDFRKAGAVALVESLSKKSDINLGVVDLDGKATLITGLTPDRAAATDALKSLDQVGATNIADGVLKGLEAFASGGRPDATRVMLLFSDGVSSREEAMKAAEEAKKQGIAVHAIQLGSREQGETLLKEAAAHTGGSHIQVEDPAKLPEAFLALRTTGIDHVALSVEGSPKTYETYLTGGNFVGRVPLAAGENRIKATATSLYGKTESDTVTVIVASPLSVRIAAPADRTLYAKNETGATVEGTASAFGSAAQLSPSLADRGVKAVTLRVNDSVPYETFLQTGAFVGKVPLAIGENRITATASDMFGRKADASVNVTVRPPGCGELHVMAERDGTPVVSLSDRVVEIILDASGSMWAQIDGVAKIETAKETLRLALEWLPQDLALALRIYGHQHGREEKNCEDSALEIPPGVGNRDPLRAAIARFVPKGQTPIAYSLEQVPADLASFSGVKTVVLLTDGIESCNGDPAAAAQALQGGGQSLPVHVIGFGLADAPVESLASLEAIAKASGGVFLAAQNAAALREALEQTVGSSFKIMRDGQVVGEGRLGANNRFSLKSGNYIVRVESLPPHEATVTVNSEEAATLIFRRTEEGVAPDSLTRQPLSAYAPCP